jgi:CheY-like chemotaxis protein/anti-sigma regulatory factor (Ser/Thr protein kinase)
VTPERDNPLRSSSRIRVLLVEDDGDLRQALVELLAAAGIDVDEAEDGAAAWEMLDSGEANHDVVITDRMMPRLDGIELLRKIKTHRELALLPVIILTVATEPRQVVEGIDAGAYAYLPKPVEADVLISMIRSAAADWRHVQELSRHIQTDAETWNLARQARFEYRSPNQAMGLGALLAKACPDPDRVVMGLSELLVNAIEHGNLEIGYEEKSRLLESQGWQAEVDRRLSLPEYTGRIAVVELERSSDAVVFKIHDQGRGFEPGPYLEIDPARVFDAHGRGIAMAKLLSFDELRYKNGGRCAVATVLVSD